MKQKWNDNKYKIHKSIKKSKFLSSLDKKMDSKRLIWFLISILLITRFQNFLSAALYWFSVKKLDFKQNNKCSQYFHFCAKLKLTFRLQFCICNLRKKIAFQCNFVRFRLLHTKCACECPTKPIMTDFERTAEFFFVNLTCRRVLFDVWFFTTKTTQFALTKFFIKKSGKQRCSSVRVRVTMRQLDFKTKCNNDFYRFFVTFTQSIQNIGPYTFSDD